ncbi:O-antigen ligase family protein [Enterococcus xiangfangensis]|uniref:O-antigen ligase family protein n=1 Tax=Enterococcus xiangfangensis TaxID=1296537 RepID=UPI003D17B6EA|nr:O-antigen ligase domain-containing protein [Enterococcus asini]
MFKIEKFKEYYLISLLVMLLFRSINAYSLLPSKYDSSIFAVLGIIGGLLIIHELLYIIKNRQLINFENILFIFLFFLGISILVNYPQSFVSNIRLMVWTALYLVGIYRFSERNHKKIHLINTVNKILIYSFFLISLVSFGMYLLKFSYVYVYGPGPRDHIRIGFLESRLFGAFGDPNYGATMSLIVLVLTIFYLISRWEIENTLYKIFLFFNVILQFFVILLTGSRSALLISFIVVMFTVFVYSLNFFDTRKVVPNIISRVILSVAISLITLGLYFGLQAGTKKVLQILPQHISYELKIDNNKSEKRNLIVKRQFDEQDKKSGISLTRKDVSENSDVSNMRFSIWKSAIEIFKTTPLVGTSPRNLITYAHENLPNTFIAQRSIVVHNAYINVLVSTGILGFLPFTIFLILNGVKIIVFFFRNKNNLPAYFFVYLTILIVLVLSGLFNNEIVLVNTVGTFIFWLYLGNINGYMKGRILDDKSKNEP